MTGKGAGADRTTVVATVEVRWRSFYVGLIGALPGLLLTAVLYPLVNAWSFLAIPAMVAVAFYLIERRTRDGLKLPTYRAMLDRRRSTKGRFFLCWEEITPRRREFTLIRRISMEIERDDDPRADKDLYED